MESRFRSLCLFLCVLGCFAVESNDADTPDEAYLEYVDKVLSSALKIEASPLLTKQYEQRVERVQRSENRVVDINYHCDPVKLSRSTSVPASVHQLRPSDIKVVAAFGDSITACNGCRARNLVEMAVEKRGESWSIGSDRHMDEGYVTLPNILNKFGAETAGYSTCGSVQYSKLAWFNVARPGARCDHMPGQAVRLVEIMKEDPIIDFENDWKLITLFIGGNDLCRYCRKPEAHNPKAYRRDIEEAVDTLKNSVPRAFVQLVTMFDLTPMSVVARSHLCSIMQQTFCECGLNATYQAELQAVQMGYYAELSDLVKDPKYSDTNDFTVVLQHHMRDLKPYYDEELEEWKSTFLSVDCFHPNIIGHRGMASWLWNAMLWPVGQKPFNNDLSATSYEICCPSEAHPYLFTNQNSLNVPQNPWSPGKTCWQPGTTRKVVRPTRGVQDMPSKDIVVFAPHRVPLEEDSDPSGHATLVGSLFGMMAFTLVVVGVVVLIRKRSSKTKEKSSRQTIEFENPLWEEKTWQST